MEKIDRSIFSWGMLGRLQCHSIDLAFYWADLDINVVLNVDHHAMCTFNSLVSIYVNKPFFVQGKPVVLCI